MQGLRPNRRRYPRIQIPVGVHLRCSGETFRGLVRVLGEGGMFIDTIHDSGSGAEMDVVIETDAPVRTKCISRNHEPGHGMGVEFIAMERGERVRIRELMSRYV